MMSQSAMQINSPETASEKWFRDAGVSSTGVSIKPEMYYKQVIKTTMTSQIKPL
jgi:hypothetical protein